MHDTSLLRGKKLDLGITKIYCIHGEVNSMYKHETLCFCNSGVLCTLVHNCAIKITSQGDKTFNMRKCLVLHNGMSLVCAVP